jgi:Zn-dependent metalloprotease
MNNQHTHVRRIAVCPIIPPYILENIVKNGSPEQKEIAQRTLQQDHQIRMQRVAQLKPMSQKAKGAATQNKKRLMYNANNLTDLPGKLVRAEGQAATNDLDVDDAYAGFGATYDLFSDIYKRNSIDDKGMDMIATVHYDYKYNNAFWDGTQMVFGDGDLARLDASASAQNAIAIKSGQSEP